MGEPFDQQPSLTYSYGAEERLALIASIGTNQRRSKETNSASVVHGLGSSERRAELLDKRGIAPKRSGLD